MNRHLIPAVGLIALGLLAAREAEAGTKYGIYDARTLAMGGASVASAVNDNALFYNAALLAFNEDIEENTRDSRILLPIIAPQLSESAFDVEDVSSRDLPDDIGRAVDAFNANPDATTAQAVVDAAAELDVLARDLQGEDLFGDVYVGLAISEPGRHQGAGFFLGTRVLGGGATGVTDADLALLDTYQEGLLFVASGGTQGAARPELFDANGALIDPNPDFDSTVEATGAAIIEVGVALSTQAELFGHSTAIGAAFKMQQVETFEDVERLVDDRIDVDRNEETEVDFNIDLGLAKNFGEHWRLGLAVKDAIPYNYETSLGTKIRLRPRPRFGAAYRRGPVQLAIDADLIGNEPLGSEAMTQELAAGAEWAIGSGLKLRGGYRLDLRGERAGILSGGVGAVWKRLAVDVAYAQGPDARAAALQIGFVF